MTLAGSLVGSRDSGSVLDESGHADVLLLVAILVGILLLLCGVTLR